MYRPGAPEGPKYWHLACVVQPASDPNAGDAVGSTVVDSTTTPSSVIVMVVPTVEEYDSDAAIRCHTPAENVTFGGVAPTPAHTGNIVFTTVAFEK